MTDFNLEQFKAGRIALTREGIETRYLGTLLGHLYPLVVAVNHSENFERVESFTLDGKWYTTEEFVGLHRMDLVKMKPEKKKLYIAINKKPYSDIRCYPTFHTVSNAHENKDSLNNYGEPESKYEIVEVEIEV